MFCENNSYVIYKSNNLPSTVYYKIPKNSIWPFLHKKCKIDWHCQFYRKYMTFGKGACRKKYKFVVFFDSDCSTLPPIAMTIPTLSMMQMTPSMICSGNILGPRMLIPIWELTRKNNFFFSTWDILTSVSYISHKIDDVIWICIFYAKMAKYFSIEFCCKQY